MPKLHFVGFVLISLSSSVAFSGFENLFGDEGLWNFLLHMEGLLGSSAFPSMTAGQYQVFQVSDLESGVNTAEISHPQICLIRLNIASLWSMHRGSYLTYKNEAVKDGIKVI